MASEMSKVLRRAVDAYTEEMAKEENKKIEIALDNTMKRIKDKVEEYLKRMSAAYYKGYDPISYIRTLQLHKSDTRPVNPNAKIQTSGNVSTLTFGVTWDASTMNHSNYTIKARWYDKKHKKWKDVKKTKTYTVEVGKKKGASPDEETILNFFQEGIHPNAVPEGMTGYFTPEPLFTEGKEGYIPDLIGEWLDTGELQEIFNSELKKLYN